MKAWNGLAKKDKLERGVDRELVREVQARDPQWVRERREEYLRWRIEELSHLLEADVRYAKSLKNPDAATILFLRDKYRTDRAAIDKLKRELVNIGRPPRAGAITEDEIARAKRFPMTELLGVNAGTKVKCPGHEDKNASALVYSDHVHCFVCSYHADTIDWMQKVNGLKFAEAVRALL